MGSGRRDDNRLFGCVVFVAVACRSHVVGLVGAGTGEARETLLTKFCGGEKERGKVRE